MPDTQIYDGPGGPVYAEVDRPNDGLGEPAVTDTTEPEGEIDFEDEEEEKEEGEEGEEEEENDGLGENYLTDNNQEEEIIFEEYNERDGDGNYDVLGYPEREDGPTIGGHKNIDDPDWTLEMWHNNGLNVFLPVVPVGPLTCEDNCIRKSKRVVEACKVLGKRVELALTKAGCACKINMKVKKSKCK
jgi:hypothetical protein